jgi:hypothetical protein
MPHHAVYATSWTSRKKLSNRWYSKGWNINVYKMKGLIGHPVAWEHLCGMLIICFIHTCTSKIESQWIVNLPNESEHVYGILNLEGEVHPTWDWWRSELQEYKGNGFSKSDGTNKSFELGPKHLDLFFWGRPFCIYLPPKARRGGLASTGDSWHSSKVIQYHKSDESIKKIGWSLF